MTLAYNRKITSSDWFFSCSPGIFISVNSMWLSQCPIMHSCLSLQNICSTYLVSPNTKVHKHCKNSLSLRSRTLFPLGFKLLDSFRSLQGKTCRKLRKRFNWKRHLFLLYIYKLQIKTCITRGSIMFSGRRWTRENSIIYLPLIPFSLNDSRNAFKWKN